MIRICSVCRKPDRMEIQVKPEFSTSEFHDWVCDDCKCSHGLVKSTCYKCIDIWMAEIRGIKPQITLENFRGVVP